jgi:site-specific recombinase XerC
MLSSDSWWFKATIKRTKNKQKKNISARSARHVFDMFKAAMRWGVRMGLLVRNPADAVEPPRWQPQEMKTLDVATSLPLLICFAPPEAPSFAPG